MHGSSAPALEATLRRGGIAVLVATHLVWFPGAGALVYRSVLTEWLPWIGLLPALLLLVGWARGLSTVLLATLLAVASLEIAREGSDAAVLLPVLAVLAALAHLGLASSLDRFSLDAWRADAKAPLDDLYAALRAPYPVERERWLLRSVRYSVAALLAITAWIAWLGPDLFADRAAATARAALALWLVLPLGRWYAGSVRTTTILVLYDEQCHFCSRTLQWMRALDPAATWRLHSDADLPAPLRGRAELAQRDAMFTVEGTRTERGYHAVRHLLTPYRGLALLVGVMGWTLFVKVGERAYAKIAAKRSEWFACGVGE